MNDLHQLQQSFQFKLTCEPTFLTKQFIFFNLRNISFEINLISVPKAYP